MTTNQDMRTPRAAQQVADCRTVAALYCDQRGPYPRMAQGQVFAPVGPHGEAYCFSWEGPRAIDCWDESSDARKYDGQHPVVAHPPCGPWGRLRHLYKGNEHACAPRAVEQVRRWGGVLEHPAGSLLWKHFDPTSIWDGDEKRMPGPGEQPDHYGGYTIEVDQCEWGHVARKRTWLYLVGVPREALEAPPFPGREPTHYASGGRTKSSRTGGAVPAGMKVCSAQQRRRTPPLFAEYLVRLARSACL